MYHHLPRPRTFPRALVVLTLALALLLAQGCNGSRAAAPGAKPGVLYLARHGQTAWNRVSRFQGDPDLDSVGYLNRVNLWQLLKDTPLVSIFTSDKQRTQRTAALVAREHGLVIKPRSALSEISSGVLEGICFVHMSPNHAQPTAKECEVPARGSRPALAQKAVRAIWAKVRRHGYAGRAPQAESYLDVTKRMKPAIQEVRAALAGGNVLVVGHGVVNRIALHLLLGWPLENVGRLRQENDQVFRIEGLATAGKKRVWLNTPGYGWKRCAPPKKGERYLDCNPGPEGTPRRGEKAKVKTKAAIPAASRPAAAPTVP